MNTVICFLRGVNVGGHNKLPMEALRGLLESLGLRSPQTYVQSGNVVFGTKKTNRVRLAESIQDAIAKQFKFRPAAILRSAAELKEVVARNPYPQRAVTDPGKLLVLFLKDRPGNNAKKTLAGIRRDREELHLEGREIYIFFPDGAGRSKLPWATLGEALGTTGTGRNWNTVTKLVEMAERAAEDL